MYRGSLSVALHYHLYNVIWSTETNRFLPFLFSSPIFTLANVSKSRQEKTQQVSQLLYKLRYCRLTVTVPLPWTSPSQEHQNDSCLPLTYICQMVRQIEILSIFVSAVWRWCMPHVMHKGWTASLRELPKSRFFRNFQNGKMWSGGISLEEELCSKNDMV